MTKFFDFLVNSNVFISTCSFFLYLFYSLKSETNFFISTALLVFSGTFLCYHLLRFIPLKRGHFIEKSLNDYYKNHKLFNIQSVCIAIPLVLFGLWDLAHFNLVLLMISGVIVILYEKILFQSFEIRKIPYIKPFVIAFVWTIVCTCLNEQFYIEDIIDCFVFILLLSIPFDIKDLKSDSSQNLLTIPILLKGRIYPLLAFFYFLYAGISYYIYAENFFLISAFLYVALLNFSKKYERLYYLGFDGLIALRFLIYLG